MPNTSYATGKYLFMLLHAVMWLLLAIVAYFALKAWLL
ncbi:putative membrane protein [Anaplasma phagocytophilum str. CRT53-1]|uniref:Putative membrane protein n=1 Tax=Anaplasma phagocytophilum str. CRT53-1 TaxID=1359157 RepID=A0A0F3PUM3_ANAPH|nr:putative membrane protein [Anaplasma phagocytophilum str. CRT53-1]KJV85639.1 putative membrane protein [Anaplasma phagocytophilum str. CRT53-1]